MIITMINVAERTFVGSVAKRVKAPFLRRSCDHDDYLCLVASIKQQIQW